MSEDTQETQGPRDMADPEREDPSIAGKPEMAAENEATGQLEERERRQQATQQHGDTFAVDSEQLTDATGVENPSAPNRVTALPGDGPSEDENEDSGEQSGPNSD